MVRWVVGSILHGVDPWSYFSFQPVIHDWCNKGHGWNLTFTNQFVYTLYNKILEEATFCSCFWDHSLCIVPFVQQCEDCVICRLQVTHHLFSFPLNFAGILLVPPFLVLFILQLCRQIVKHPQAIHSLLVFCLQSHMCKLECFNSHMCKLECFKSHMCKLECFNSHMCKLECFNSHMCKLECFNLHMCKLECFKSHMCKLECFKSHVCKLECFKSHMCKLECFNSTHSLLVSLSLAFEANSQFLDASSLVWRVLFSSLSFTAFICSDEMVSFWDHSLCIVPFVQQCEDCVICRLQVMHHLFSFPLNFAGILVGLHPTWSNSQLVELLKQQSIWFSSLTDMHVVTSVIIMSCSRLAGNRLLLYRYRLTHAM